MAQTTVERLRELTSLLNQSGMNIITKMLRLFQIRYTTDSLTNW